MIPKIELLFLVLFIAWFQDMHTNKETIIRGYYNIEVSPIVVSQASYTSATVYFLKKFLIAPMLRSYKSFLWLKIQDHT